MATDLKLATECAESAHVLARAAWRYSEQGRSPDAKDAALQALEDLERATVLLRTFYMGGK